MVMTRKQFLLNLKKSGSKRKIVQSKNGVTPYALMSMKEKYLAQEIYKIGILDIETSGLGADFDRMISWALLVRDVQTGKTEIRYGVVNKKDHIRAENLRGGSDSDRIDARITRELIEAISDIDYLVGHWFIGKKRHDIPFIRSRCAINRISGFPKHKMVRYADTQKFSSQLHRLRNNGLATIADAYELAISKTPVTTKDWKNAAQFATRKALAYILDHNIKDVKITHEVLMHLEEYIGISSIYA